jgi:hypothetical protein
MLNGVPMQAENGKLTWVKCNQDVLRADVYKGVADAVYNGDSDAKAVGKRIVLPSSFNVRTKHGVYSWQVCYPVRQVCHDLSPVLMLQAGPRHMQQLYQDAMAMVRKTGKPDLFITMTCNPQWREIQEALLPGQQATDRPDIVARVFRLKLAALQHYLMKRHVLGRVGTYM